MVQNAAGRIAGVPHTCLNACECAIFETHPAVRLHKRHLPVAIGLIFSNNINQIIYGMPFAYIFLFLKQNSILFGFTGFVRHHRTACYQNNAENT